MYKCNNLQCQTTKWRGLWEPMPYLKTICQYNHQHHNQTTTSCDKKEEKPWPICLWIKGWRKNHNAQCLHQHHQEGKEESFKPSSSKVYKEEDNSIEPPQLSPDEKVASMLPYEEANISRWRLDHLHLKKHQPSGRYDVTSSGSSRWMIVEQFETAIYTKNPL